jgi:hypothetical protein
MLVDINSVTQCMVVYSGHSSARLPINHNAPKLLNMVGWLQGLSASGDCDLSSWA